MPLDPILLVADAIVAYLPTQPYAGALVVTAENCFRTYLDIRSVETLNDYKVIVVPANPEHERLSRSCPWERRLRIMVYVKAHCDTDDNAMVDPFVDLAYEIVEHLKQPPMANHTPVGVSQTNFFDDDTSTQNNVFVSEIQLDYRG